jgi:hypothetical protein
MYRQWALLGFLVCPRALHGVGAKQLLAGLLKESFIFTIYQDVMQPLHSLFGQLEGTQCGVTSTLLAEVWEGAVGGADREHKLRRMFITRCLEDMADLMEVGGAVSAAGGRERCRVAGMCTSRWAATSRWADGLLAVRMSGARVSERKRLVAACCPGSSLMLWWSLYA